MVDRPPLMRFFRFAVIGIAAVTITGCVRYEYRTMECYSRPPEGASAIAWGATPAPAGTLVIHVSVVAGLLPHPASASLGSSPWRHTSPEGVIRFDSIPAGYHELMVRKVNYNLARATIFMPADSGVLVRTVLAPERIVIDEGCGSLRRVRKPWWKVW